jgi:hypothetical protein
MHGILQFLIGICSETEVSEQLYLLSVVPELKRPNKNIDPHYKGEYDLYLPCPTGNIKIEVKASRAVDRNKPDEPLYIKALASDSQKHFLAKYKSQTLLKKNA